MTDEDIYSMPWGEFTEYEARKKDEQRARDEEYRIATGWAHIENSRLGIYDSANDSCFITTAVCSSLGLGNNCDILQTLRYFRDTFMMATARRRELVKHYYKNAPGIIKIINKGKDAKEIYRNLLFAFILPCYRKILAGKNTAALRIYRNCFIFLEKIGREKVRKKGGV